jgi:competence ComEA-like helix-hairpin-helix protein
MKNLSVRIALLTTCLVIVVTCGIIASGAWVGGHNTIPAYTPRSDSGDVPIESPGLSAGKTGLTAGKSGKVKITITIKLPKPIKIKFNGNGGSAAKSEKTVYKGKKFGALPKATRKDYTLTGWYTAKKGGSMITPDTVVKLTRAKTYYAHWAKAEPFGPPLPSADVLKVNINTASQSRLLAITGVGVKIADAIIDYRTANGPFQQIEDLMKVKGIGKATFEKMKNQVTV